MLKLIPSVGSNDNEIIIKIKTQDDRNGIFLSLSVNKNDINYDSTISWYVAIFNNLKLSIINNEDYITKLDLDCSEIEFKNNHLIFSISSANNFKMEFIYDILLINKSIIADIDEILKILYNLS